jgi:hypothetical protein
LGASQRLFVEPILSADNLIQVVAHLDGFM